MSESVRYEGSDYYVLASVANTCTDGTSHFRVWMKTEDWDNMAFYYLPGESSCDCDLQAIAIIKECQQETHPDYTHETWCDFILGDIPDWEARGLSQERNTRIAWRNGLNDWGATWS